MIRSLTTCALAAFSFLTLNAGCAVEMPDEEEVVELEGALCSNPSPVDSAMAAIAVAAAREMGRLVAARDFRWNSSTGRLEITAYGYNRCNYIKAGSTCPNTQAALALQNAPSWTVQFPSGHLDSAQLRNALKANYAEQAACESNGSCPIMSWDLKYHSTKSTSCYVEYLFNAYHQYKTLKIYNSDLYKYGNNMRFLGYPENKMLNFYVAGDLISIDPTAGLNEGGTTTTGSCTVACTKYSPSSLVGQCCSCNGSTKRYQQSSFSKNYYLCR
ncbi:MAG TPA: hypothetical protein VER33_22645 [Polyangiaceae bacterium]|nr:hypothetical protein [Polyangiaceae bacterium]